MQTTTLKVSGMSCGSCAAHIEKALKALPGVESVAVEISEQRVTVQHRGVAEVKLAEAVTAEGYEVQSEK
jgi:copper chaperone CopZ